MTTQIINLAVYRAEHPRDAVRVRVTFDPLRAWRLWLACWGVESLVDLGLQWAGVR